VPPLDSDEPATGPPSPAPVLEAPSLDARPGGSALAAPVPVLPMPVSEPIPEPAPRGGARAGEGPRPEKGLEDKPRPEEKLRSDEKPRFDEKPRSDEKRSDERARSAEKLRSDEKPTDRARSSGDRLRSTRPSEVAAPARSSAHDHPPASFGIRLLSGLADALVLGAVEAVVLAPIFHYWSGRTLPRTLGDVSFLPIMVSVLLVPLAGAFAVAYSVYWWGVRGATPGQGFFELVVESENGERPIGPSRAALRLVGYLLSLAS